MTDSNTLGNGTLTAEQVRECVQHVYYEGYNDGSVHRAHGIEETDWQAIADELNATLVSGTCAQCAKDMGAYADSLCDPLKERINKLLRCLENDWHISASWDGLRKFWNIELTDEGVRLRDEAATLGSGECEPKWTLQGTTQTQEFWRCECGNCGYEFGIEDRSSFPFKMTIDKVELPNFCPECGKAVKR